MQPQKINMKSQNKFNKNLNSTVRRKNNKEVYSRALTIYINHLILLTGLETRETQQICSV